MENWKIELQKVARDFFVPARVLYYIITETEKETAVPSFYTVTEEYLYDTAQRKLKRYILKQLSVA